MLLENMGLIEITLDIYVLIDSVKLLQSLIHYVIMTTGFTRSYSSFIPTGFLFEIALSNNVNRLIQLSIDFPEGGQYE